MTLDLSTYFSSLVSQIGFEKSTFDNLLNFALMISLGVAGLSLTLLVVTDAPKLVMIIAGLGLSLVLSLFFRAVRSYRNYYSYMRLKNLFVESEVLPSIRCADVQQAVENVDLRRSREGDRIAGLSPRELCWRVLWHTEFLLLLAGLLTLDVMAFVNSGAITTVLSGYVILAHVAALAFVVRGIRPEV